MDIYSELRKIGLTRNDCIEVEETVIIPLLEKLYAKTAGMYNDYGRDEYDYIDIAKDAVAKFVNTGDF